MKLLIYGSLGWIGSQFKTILLKNNINFYEGLVRVDNYNDLINEITNINPTHIISFIGRTHGKIGNKEYSTIDYLEQKDKLYENIRDNLFSPLLLSTICGDKDIHLTYLGTGCIFSYDKNHPFGEEINGFSEKDLPNFFGSSYSIMKGFTDRLMTLSKNTLNLRIRMPITDSQHPRNFITKITNYKNICSIPNSMTVLPELLPIVLDMIGKNITGTINLTNPGLISHNEILEIFRDVVDPTFKWENFTKEEQSKILDSDRSNNYLDTTKLVTLYPDIKNIKDSVKLCLQNYKKTYIPNTISNNYTPKNMLVTGGCGFIGSNFINKYIKKNPNTNIINIDALYYCANIENINKSVRELPNYTFIKGNICSVDLITYVLDFYNIDTIIHFAAQSHVDNSFENSLQYTNDNIVGTHTLLECCRKYVEKENNEFKRFIHVSTDEVYGESNLCSDELKKNEQSILCPTNPYAATKAGAELLVQSYYTSFKLPVIITRGNNVYGPNQYPEKLIPKFIHLLKNNKKVTIQGRGDCLRSFIHSDDVTNAFSIILEKGKIGEIYNIGSDIEMEYSIIEVTKILVKLIKNTDNYEDWIEYIDDRPFNDKRYHIDNIKLKDLGWNINVSFIDGLKALI